MTTTNHICMSLAPNQRPLRHSPLNLSLSNFNYFVQAWNRLHSKYCAFLLLSSRQIYSQRTNQGLYHGQHRVTKIWYLCKYSILWEKKLSVSKYSIFSSVSSIGINDTNDTFWASPSSRRGKDPRKRTQPNLVRYELWYVLAISIEMTLHLPAAITC